MESAKNLIHKWHEVIDSDDLNMLDSILADDAVFSSPVVFTPMEGKEITKIYLHAAVVVGVAVAVAVAVTMITNFYFIIITIPFISVVCFLFIFFIIKFSFGLHSFLAIVFIIFIRC